MVYTCEWDRESGFHIFIQPAPHNPPLSYFVMKQEYSTMTFIFPISFFSCECCYFGFGILNAFV